MTSIFHVRSADFILKIPIPVDGGPEALSRYMRSYYVRAGSSEDAAEIVRADGESEGAAIVEMEPPVAKKRTELPMWLLPRLLLGRDRGVVWRSGRAFYPQADST